VLNSPLAGIAFSLAGVAFAVVGSIIVWGRPGNLTGWLCLTFAFGQTILLGRYLAFTLLVQPETSLPSLLAIAPLAQAGWLVPASCLLVLIIVFPSGSPATRGMLAVAWLVPAIGVSAMTLTAIQPGNLPASFEQYENALGVSGLDRASEFGSGLNVAFALIGVVAGVDMLRRFLRSTGDERQQFKWFAYVAAWIPPLAVLYVVTEPNSAVGPCLAGPDVSLDPDVRCRSHRGRGA
jgi:hypothetical protein